MRSKDCDSPLNPTSYPGSFLRSLLPRFKSNNGKTTMIKLTLLYKIEGFIDFSATNKIDNLTCVDYHETH